MAGQILELLERVRTGDPAALGELTPTLYGEMRLIAARHLRGERANHMLQATALVHETYLKLLGADAGQYADRVHFLAIASRVMRQVLVDYARARVSQKRDGDVVSPLWTGRLEIKDESCTDLVDLIEMDGALMRYFGAWWQRRSRKAWGCPSTFSALSCDSRKPDCADRKRPEPATGEGVHEFTLRIVYRTNWSGIACGHSAGRIFRVAMLCPRSQALWMSLFWPVLGPPDEISPTNRAFREVSHTQLTV